MNKASSTTFACRSTTARSKGSKAKLVIHKAYGFRTAKNYIRNLYHCLGNLPLPQTVHTFV